MTWANPNRIEKGDDWGNTMRKLAPCGLCGTYTSRLTGCRHWNPSAQRSASWDKKRKKAKDYRERQKQKDSQV